MAKRRLSSLTLPEQSAPSTPAAGYMEIYADTSHKAHIKDSTGADLTLGLKGFVNHGSTGSTARPPGYTSVEWYGSATPANAVAGDTWIDTT